MFYRRFVLCAVVLLLSVIMSGCDSSIFVGVEAASPNRFAVQSVETAPIPPLGPRNFRGERRGRGAGPEAAADLPLISTVSGPAFNWQETENYLLLGTDRRSPNDNWRTDTIIVIGLDRKNKRAAVLSVPRDLYVAIPEYGNGRINQVDYIGERVMRIDGGGPALVSQVLEETIGVSTKHWIRVEMSGFQSVVNAVGGVTVHLDCPFYEPIFNLTTNSWDYFVLPAGENHLDGEAAYWFVRLRLRESDIGRAQRQRQFLWGMRNQFQSANLIVRIPELWSAFQETFSTDLTLLQMIDLAQVGLSLDPANVRSAGITLQELSSHTTAAGASVLVIRDEDRVRSVVNDIWNAPAMADTYRQNVERCAPLPSTGPWLPAQAQADPAPTGDNEPADDEMGNAGPGAEPVVEIEAASEAEQREENSGAALLPPEQEERAAEDHDGG